MLSKLFQNKVKEHNSQFTISQNEVIYSFTPELFNGLHELELCYIDNTGRINGKMSSLNDIHTFNDRNFTLFFSLLMNIIIKRQFCGEYTLYDRK